MLPLLLAIAIVTGEPNTQPQPGFRVETEMLLGNATEPTGRWETLFEGPLVIDTDLNDPNVTTVFHLTDGLVTKLDTKKQQKATVTFGELERLLAELRLGLNGEQAKAFGVDATPQAMPAGRWRVVGDGWQYDVVGQAEPVAQAAQRYGLFANNAARLNVLDRRGRPPFVRILLNDALSQAGLIPSEISLSGAGGGRTRHRATAKLSEKDLQRFADVKKLMEQYREVAWAELKD